MLDQDEALHALIMRSNSLYIIFFLLLPHVFSAHPDIHSICSRVSDSKGCVSSVKTTIGDGSAPVTSLKVEIDALSAGIHAANTKAQALVKDETLGAYARSIVVPKCVAMYKDAINNLDNINTALGSNDGELMQNSLDAIDSLATLCEDAFDEAHLPSPLKDENTAIESAVIACIGRAFKFWRSHIEALKSSSSPSAAPSPASSPSPSSSTEKDRRKGSDSPSPASSPTESRLSYGPLDPLDVMTVCSMTRDMSFCMSAVQSAATEPITSTNAATVLKLAVNATIVSTTTAIETAHALSKAHNHEPRVQDILTTVCASKFERAIKKLQGAAEAITKGDKLRMKDSLAVAGHYMACERAFADAHLPRLMEDYNEDLKALATMNLGIAKVFWPDPMFDREYNYALQDV